MQLTCLLIHKSLSEIFINYVTFSKSSMKKPHRGLRSDKVERLPTLDVEDYDDS